MKLKDLIQTLSKSTLLLLLVFCVCGCSDSSSVEEVVEAPIFTEVDPESIGIDFYNGLYETKDFNIVTYEYIYNGGGVGIGDFNNDGLEDVFFTGTKSPDQLYFNDGGFKFTNVSKSAGIIQDSAFTTGVVVVDINQDGYDDIYVCKTGKGGPNERVNLLYINNQNGTFNEEASEYGIDSDHHTNHANFFDYDNDGDLDLYVLNHPVDFDNSQQIRVRPDRKTGGYLRTRTPKTEYDSDQLFENNGNGTFTEVTEEAGISNYGYGLSVSILDVNKDGWDDIYIANDYIETDMLYVNQKDGSFKNELNTYFSHISENSMGSDAADIDDDGDLDLIVLDMVPESSQRQKQLISSMTYKRFTTLLTVGYEPQIMKNVLQLNSGQGGFHEVSYQLGVSNTDWSWAPLFEDYDNDGDKDLFISNGFRRDITDCDYTNYKSDSLKKMDFKGIQEYYKAIPETPVYNYLYEKKDNELAYNNVTNKWGITTATFSNGAAFADFDNNGTLDLMVNNNDGRPSIYKNSTDGHFIRLRLAGAKNNINGIGAEVILEQSGKKQYRTVRRTRGYFSTIEKHVHFGVDDDKVNIKVNWPDGRMSEVSLSAVDTVLTIDHKDAQLIKLDEEKNENLVLKEVSTLPTYIHRENNFNDFNRQSQVIYKQSEMGPRLSISESFSNKMIFVPGPAGQASEIWTLNQESGQYENQQKLVDEINYEDIEGHFLDLDNDGDEDLIVLTGGSHLRSGDDLYRDRYYRNENGRFELDIHKMPALKTNAGAGILFDYDADGDLDLFVGSRVKPGSFPQSEVNTLYTNVDGRFIDGNSYMSSELANAGMLTDVFFVDTDNDGEKELGLIGELTSVQLFGYGGKTINLKETIPFSGGIWNTVLPTDIDNDGDIDLIVGNIGLNTNYKANQENPFTLYGLDYDGNGQIDPIAVQPYVDGNFPIMTRGEILSQLPILQRTLKNYQKYSYSKIEDIIDSKSLESALKLEAHTLENGVFINEGGALNFKALPTIMQSFPIYAIEHLGMDQNGHNQYLVGGNEFQTNVHSGPNDAGYLMLLTYNSESHEMDTKYVLSENKLIKGDIRSIEKINFPNLGELILIGTKNKGVKAYLWEQKEVDS